MVKNVKNRRGVTLVELMVAVAIMSIGILGFFGAFRYITMSLRVSRARTLATNLAQEKVESLKNLSYYQLLITTAPLTDNTVSPPIVYDSSNYAPETINIGNIRFTRYTYVALAQIDSGSISTVTYTFPDTGMKQITVNILWDDGGNKKRWGLTNLLENPNVSPLDSGFTGTVVTQAGTGLAGAFVRAEQNPDYNASSDNSGTGAWQFRVYHGSYTIRASSAGYFDAISSIQSITAGSNVTVPPLVMQAIGSGTISGIAWLNKDLVISQVAISTYQSGENQFGTAFNNFGAEYIELYNPTTFPINIGTTGSPVVKVNFKIPTTCSYQVECSEGLGGIKLVYYSTFVAPGRYYVIANTGTFVAGGQLIYPDAVYADDADTNCVDQPEGVNWNEAASPQLRHILNMGHGGTLWISRDGAKIDAVGWSHNAQTYTGFEGTAITFTSGFQHSTQIVRLSSPTATLIEANQTTYGRAYDSGYNNEDFIYSPLSFDWVAPSSSTMASVRTLTGKPAVGANIAASDPYSGSTIATPGYISSGTLTLLYAPFNLVGVGTTPVSASCAGACWDLVIATNGYTMTIATISVQQATSTGVPNGATVSSWTVANHIGVQLTTASVGGFVSGRITDLTGAPISNLTVVAGGISKRTASNGVYFIATSSGLVSVTANPNNSNTSYVQAISNVTVETGQITQADFILSRGGTIQGYLTSGTTPLPNFIVAATQGGSQFGSGASNTSGVFYIRNLSTGTYTVAPVLETGQDAQPNSVSTTLTTAGVTVFSATFTVSGAFGEISGTVTNGGQLVTSGALLLASTGTIPSTPTEIAGSSAPALSPMYAVSSRADGSYVLPVRGGNTYYLSVYVPTISAAGSVSVTTKTYTSIYVTPSQATTQLVTLP